jgi:hypothetical protein
MWIVSAIRDKLFGTWDRGVATISISITVIGAGITVFYVKNPDKIPEYIAFRDFVLWFALILLSLFLVAKYYFREAVIQRQKNFLSEQFKLSHDLVHNYRNNLFKNFYQPKVQQHKLTERDWMIFRELCSSITEGVKDSFSEYFRSRGIGIGIDLSVSVKLLITPQEVLNRFTFNQEKQQQILAEDQWVITVFRDHYTYNHVYSRETNVTIYDIDKNTDLRRIVRNNESEFFNNDLQSLKNAYENENNNWSKYYNATLVVPIRYLSPESRQHRCYGLLAVDSLNSQKRKDLYNDEECKYILGHAADLLATFFLLLELTELKQTQAIPVVSPVPERS